MSVPRTLRRFAVLVAVASAPMLAGCGSSAVTRPRLERSLPQVFSNLYVKQAAILGHKGISVDSLHARAMCDKHGPAVSDVGPGGDWTCLMSWTDPNVPLPDGWGKFELNVHSNACYTAAGPTRLVGFLTIGDPRGRDVVNPVFEFDGCFDPNADNTPTGVIFHSALSIATDPVHPDRSRRVSLKLTCSLGDAGCAGVVNVSRDTSVIDMARYALEPGRNDAVTVRLPKRASGGELTLTVTPTTGTAPAAPTVVPLTPA